MTDDPRQATELETLKAVLDECGKRKLTIGAISVGSIRLVLAIPLSEPMPSTPAKRLTAEEEELLVLRKKSAATFGRVLPDEELRAMKGAL